jgi:group II intron reverse transcriptase/maturase
VQQKRINHVVEADIRSFFDQVNQDWLVRFLEHRMGDQRVIRLIIRMLRGGILEEGLVKPTEEGTPQGSILSPLLSNVYLHYVLDLWFRVRVAKRSRGEAHLFRYADDFVACFQYKDEAEAFEEMLKARLEGFGLEVAEEKTRRIEFGRYARENARRAGKKPESFEFLGFTHYGGKTRKGGYKVKRRTSRKKLQKALREFSEWARQARKKQRKGEMIRGAISRVRGHLSYYAVTDNWHRCQEYEHWAKRHLFRWINRKSQRRAYTWAGFNEAVARAGWPTVRATIDLNPFARRMVQLSLKGI